MAAGTPGCRAAASWGPRVLPIWLGSSHLLLVARGWERPRLDAMSARVATFPCTPALAPSCLYPILPLLLLTDYMRRNEAFVFRGPGQNPNKRKNLDNA